MKTSKNKEASKSPENETPPVKVVVVKRAKKQGMPVPKEGLEYALSVWAAILEWASHASNFRLKSDVNVHVKSFDSNEWLEFRWSHADGWYRVKAGVTVRESISRELMSWLVAQKFVTWEEVDRRGPLITRQITEAERRICLGSGRGRPLSRDTSWKLLADPAMRRILQRRDAK